MAKSHLPDRPLPWRTWDDFSKWFWKDKNSDDLIEKLNTYSFKRKGATCHRIRKEQDSPTIYGIVIHDDMEVGDWKFCQISSADENSSKSEKAQNQVEVLTGDIDSLDIDGKLLFKLPVDFGNVGKVYEVENQIRKAIGYPVHKDLAQHLELPNPSEWALTTLPYIRILKDAIKKDMGAQLVSTKIFTKVKFEHERAPELPNWLQVRSGKVIRKP